MKQNRYIIGIVIAFLLVLQGCGQDEPGSGKSDYSYGKGLRKTENQSVDNQDTSSQPLKSLADVRHPDMRIRVRKGNTLQLETDGFQLLAVDTAVMHTGEYSVTSLIEEDLAPLPQGMKNMTAATAGYRLLPSGEHFAPYAELRVAYDPARLPFGYTPEDIYTSYYDTASMLWVRLERLYIDTANHEVVSATTHFTDFINELLQSPEMPETQAFVPTQMSGLEAANPLAGYSLVAAPEPNNMGTANLTYPIQVPAGRGGIQPRIELTYNSNGGNGVCGMGWDLPVPSISVETRWGVPLYDSLRETETYLFNGEQLLVSPDSMPTFSHAPVERDRNHYTKRFYPRVEGAFDSILRHGTLPQTYWWEVFDRSGTRYIYGLGDGELRSQQKKGIAKWYLTRVMDRNGNTLRYHYRTYKNNEGGRVSGTALLLDNVSYTSTNDGFPNQPWYGYCVTFHYGEREDPVITGNYGVKENLCLRLDSVKTWFVKNEAISRQNDFSFLEINNFYGYDKEWNNPNLEITDTYDTIERFSILSWLNNRDVTVHTDSSLIRGYLLFYKNSAVTNKSLLSAVAEMSASEWETHAGDITYDDLSGDNVLKYHRFEYKGAPQEAFCSTPVMLQTSIWKGQSGLHDVHASPLGGERSYRTGVSFSAGAGLGCDPKKRTINIEASGSFSPVSSSNGASSLIDLNGDGYPDLLFYGDDEWHCQRFSPEDSVFLYADETFLSFPTFGFSKSVTKDDYSIGVGAHAGWEYEVEGWGANIGAQYTHSRSENTMYFVDVNADGKPDIVKDGLVWFNNSHDDTVTFDREFVPQSTSGNPCETGYYSLENTVGFDYTIFDEGHYSETYVSCIGKGLTDSVAIIPSELQTSHADTLRRSVVRVWVAPEEGNIRITGTAMLDTLFDTARARTCADGVHVSIQHNRDTLPGACHDLTPTSPMHNMEVKSIYVDYGDRLYFRVEALKNDLYDVVDWSPTIAYYEFDTTLLDGSGRRQYVFSAKEDFLAWQEEFFSMPEEGLVNISADYRYTGTLQNDITLRIVQLDTSGYYVRTLDSQTLLASDTSWRHKISWEVNRLYIDTLSMVGFVVESADDLDRTKLIWTPHVTSDRFDNGDEARFWMYDENGEIDSIYAIDRYMSPIFYKEKMADIPDYIDPSLFGNLNHGWGYFVYNSDSLRTPIIEERIKKDPRNDHQNIDIITDSVAVRYDTSMAVVPVDSLLAETNRLLPNPDIADVSTLDAFTESDSTGRILVAFAGKAYVTPAILSLYNWHSVQAALKDSSLLFPVTNQSVSASGQRAVGPIKGNSQQGFSVHASAGLSCGGGEGPVTQTFGLNACVNYSHGENRLTADFMDFNGDGYPDAISENTAQYTNSWGGFSSKTAGITPSGEQGIQNTVYNAFSLQGGASYANYYKTGKRSGNLHIDMRSCGAGVGEDNSIAISNDHLSHTWMDMNGDGLPDCIHDNKVAINLGYDYYKPELISNNPLPENQSLCNNKSSNTNFSGAVDGVEIVKNSVKNTVNHSFSAGKSLSESVNTGKVIYIDINGDGLVDKIEDGRHVFYNTGWGFSSSYQMINVYVEQENISHNIDYTGNLTLGFPMNIPFVGCCKIQGSAGTSIGNSASTTEAMLTDMNADGLPDIVRSNGENVKVWYNRMYDLDKLSSVETFYGNRMDLDYSQATYSPHSRQRPTVMSGLIVSDLTETSVDQRRFTYDYVDYVYSVAERTPYGFDSVVITQYQSNTPYRITRQHYRTDHYKMRGRKQSELVIDSSGRPYVENVWDYTLKQISNGQIVDMDSADCFGATWPALNFVLTRYYNPATQEVKIETMERYTHCDSGRVSMYVNYNNTATSSDDAHCEIGYTRRGRNQYALPRKVTVTDDTGTVIRMRSAEYNTKGMLSELAMHNYLDITSVYRYSYDEYGNTRSYELPPNENGQRTKYLYGYDTLIHMFRTLTVDSVFGDASRTEYDIRLGLPLRVYSIGGDSISYTYDDWGRPLTIRAPLEANTVGYPTIQYGYWDSVIPAPQVNLPDFKSFTRYPAEVGMIQEPQCNKYKGWPIWAQTLHHSKPDPEMEVATVLFSDGHGRVLQTRKTAVVEGTSTQVASGHIIYDDAGRPVETYEPFVTNNDFCIYATPVDTGVYTSTDYDVMDRVVRTSVPSEGIVTTTSYGFVRLEDIPQFFQQTTDPENNNSFSIIDVRGLTLQNTDAQNGKTQFRYSPLGLLVQSIDPDTISTYYQYDMLGQLRVRRHPDAGTTSYFYDPAGHLRMESTPLGDITYYYNYQRLVRKEYSYSTSNGPLYTYGTSGKNRGRLISVSNASVKHQYSYDALGQVENDTCIVAIPGDDHAYQFVTSNCYDSWGRVLNMTYPDGEIVRYHYNAAGCLDSMTGSKANVSDAYIKRIHYNKYGQRISVTYGDNTSAEYHYDPLHRLSKLKSRDSYGNTMQDISYSFDRTGNILTAENHAATLPYDALGGQYRNNYSYDPLYRLTSAVDSGVCGSYNLSTGYTPGGRIGWKQTHSVTPGNTGYSILSFGYCRNNQPHAPKRINDAATNTLYDLQWDEAGNLGRVNYLKESGVWKWEKSRHLFWTEDNRLHTVVDDKFYGYYSYDPEGERVLKLVGENTEIDVNANYQHTAAVLNTPTLYPSPCLVMGNHGYTKHYYAGSERVCAKIGGGFGKTISVINSAMTGNATELFEQCYDQVVNRELSPNETSCIHSYGPVFSEDLQAPIYGVLQHLLVDTSINYDVFHSMVGKCEVGYEGAEDVYYYHGDHLGSASWITNKKGYAVQHLQYLPFGEPFVDQHTTGYSERFRFTGKERDEETGYGYFGARYMDYSLLTSFFSVDRYASKYPFISPYVYCAWNPIKLTDPNGDTIRPTIGSSPEFVSQLNMAIQYLVDNGADDVYSRLQSNSTIVYVSEVDFKDAEFISSDPKSKNIEWCPTAGVYTTEGVMMSPTTVLEHEFDHMLRSLENPTQQDADYNNKVDFYGNSEEVRVIDGSEQTTACRLGEIKDGQFTRKNHAGNFYEVLSPISTTLKNPAQTLKKPSVMPRNLPVITIR